MGLFDGIARWCAPAKASKPRHAMMIQYVTPYAATFDLDGPLPTPAIGVKAIPPEPSPLEEYLFGLRR